MNDVARRKRVLNRLTVIRLVLQVLLRNPLLVGARWWLRLALNAVDELTIELTGAPPQTREHAPQSSAATNPYPTSAQQR